MKEEFQGLEELIKKEFSQVKQLDGVFQVPLQKWLPTDFVAQKFGFDNYRVPTTTGLNLLATSIKMYGLIERPVLVIVDETNELKFVDGRRRTSACYINNYQEIPFDIYRLPKEKAHELEVSLNALKTAIPIYDRVQYTKGLREEFLLFKEVNEDTVAKEIASVMNLSPKTIQGYFEFLDAHKHLQEYAQKNRGLQLYGQIRQIVRNIPNKNHQLEFFSWYKKNHLEKKDKKKLSARDFSKKLKQQVAVYQQAKEEQIESQDVILLRQWFQTHKSNWITDQAKSAKELTDFLKVNTQVIALDEEFQEEILNTTYKNMDFNTFFSSQLASYKKELEKAPSHLKTKINTILEEKPKLTFAQMQLKKLTQLQKKRKTKRPKVVAQKAMYIPTEDITRDPNNLRKGYDLEKITKLSIDMKANGQMKAGIITPSKEVPTPFMAIVGNSRHYAAEIAKIPYYKAFILKNADSSLVKILQAVEDLYEADTYFERAQKLYSNYLITKESKESEGLTYTPEEFIAEKGHLAPKKTLEDAMYVMSLSPIAKHLIREKITSAQVGKTIDTLDKSTKVSAIINILSQKMNKKQSLEYIDSINLPKLFPSEETHSYQNVITNLFQRIDHSSHQLQLFSQVVQKREDIAEKSDVAYLRVAKAYKEIKNLYEGLSSVQ